MNRTQLVNEIAQRHAASMLRPAQDARQCAEDLGMRPCQDNEQALRELERVGLGWTAEAARRPKNGPGY